MPRAVAGSIQRITMKKRDLENLGIYGDRARAEAIKAASQAKRFNLTNREFRSEGGWRARVPRR